MTEVAMTDINDLIKPFRLASKIASRINQSRLRLNALRKPIRASPAGKKKPVILLHGDTVFNH